MLKQPISRQKLAKCWFLPSLFLFVGFQQQALAEFKTGITSTSQLAVQVFLGLLLVLALIFSLVWLGKKMRFLPNNLQAKGVMRPLANLSLGPKERLILVEVGNEQLLLGVTSQQINLVHQLAQPISFTEEAKKAPAFAQMFSQWKAANQAASTHQVKKTPSTQPETPSNEADH